MRSSTFDSAELTYEGYSATQIGSIDSLATNNTQYPLVFLAKSSPDRSPPTTVAITCDLDSVSSVKEGVG